VIAKLPAASDFKSELRKFNDSNAKIFGKTIQGKRENMYEKRGQEFNSLTISDSMVLWTMKLTIRKTNATIGKRPESLLKRMRMYIEY
jgi:hypothetical protein